MGSYRDSLGGEEFGGFTSEKRVLQGYLLYYKILKM